METNSWELVVADIKFGGAWAKTVIQLSSGKGPHKDSRGVFRTDVTSRRRPKKKIHMGKATWTPIDNLTGSGQ